MYSREINIRVKKRLIFSFWKVFFRYFYGIFFVCRFSVQSEMHDSEWQMYDREDEGQCKSKTNNLPQWYWPILPLQTHLQCRACITDFSNDKCKLLDKIFEQDSPSPALLCIIFLILANKV